MENFELRGLEFRNHDNNSNSTVAVPAPAVVAVALIALAVAVVRFWRKSCTLVGFHIVIFLCVKKSGTGKERYAEWGMTSSCSDHARIVFAVAWTLQKSHRIASFEHYGALNFIFGGSLAEMFHFHVYLPL